MHRFKGDRGKCMVRSRCDMYILIMVTFVYILHISYFSIESKKEKSKMIYILPMVRYTLQCCYNLIFSTFYG